MKKQKQIAVVSILLTITFILLVLSVGHITYATSDKDSIDEEYSISNSKLNFYKNISYNYQTDKEVIKVYETCLNSEIKAICVYENIDFVWSKSFESMRENYTFSPTEMVEQNGYGLCRDIAVFRMATFKKLDILTDFVFIPKHVYLRVFEGGKIYELDNGNLRELK